MSLVLCHQTDDNNNNNSLNNNGQNENPEGDVGDVTIYRWIYEYMIYTYFNVWVKGLVKFVGVGGSFYFFHIFYHNVGMAMEWVSQKIYNKNENVFHCGFHN